MALDRIETGQCFEPRVSKILERILAVSKKIFRENLLGIYLHGSLAFGCFLWESSDIDLLLVTEMTPSQKEKEQMIRELLVINEQCPPKGLEISLVLDRYLRPFCYPTPFELHYSNAHIKSCEENLEQYCANMLGTDKDLAAHITVIRQAGITLYGKQIEQMFDFVPKADYLDSLYYDIHSAAEDILENPVYVICNLCRVLAYLTDDRILSKAEGTRWLKNQIAQSKSAFPPVLAEGLPFIEEAEKSYQTGSSFLTRGREEQLKTFARVLLLLCNSN